MTGDSCDLVLRDVLLPGGRVADISIRDGKVCHAGAGLPASRFLPCRGMTVLPAAIDMHVHMRGRTQRQKEDWESGSQSALAGGVTVVVDQPNTVPPLSTPDSFRERVREASGKSFCHFAINADVRPGTDPFPLWAAGAMAFGEIFTAASSYGAGITSEELSLVLDSVGAIGGLCTIHAEEVAGGDDRDLRAHHAIRSPAGEARAVERVRMMNRAGCRLHFCHLSSARSIRNAGDSTVEVTPHHLFLALDDFSPDDPRGKVNPPLRTEVVRRELYSVWERIDVLASDHAPHTQQEKAQPFSEAPAGIPGVETMVPLALAACRRKRFSLHSLIEKTSINPARILGIPAPGFSVGDRADFAIYPPEESRIRGDELHSRAGWSPFEGMPAVFPAVVVMGGEIVYEAGTFERGRPQWFMGRGYIPDAPTGNGADTARP